MTMSGRVDRLWRYPVKSMLGESLPDLELTETGVTGDRGFALLDTETGKIASAKAPRLWRGLLAMTARRVGDGVEIRWPGGGVDSTDADADAVLSRRLGRSVHLTDTPVPDASLDRARPDEVLAGGVDADVDNDLVTPPAGSFLDYGRVHVIAGATIAGIGRSGARGVVEPQRYRPNLLVDLPVEPFGENDWVDRRLRIGDAVELEVVVPTPRCAVPTLVHGDLSRDPDALRIPARRNRIAPVEDFAPQPCVGVYADVVRPGRISVGDPVRLA